MFSTLLVLVAFLPMIRSIVDPESEFSFGDFFTRIGKDSAEVRKDVTLKTFSYGQDNKDNNRFFLVAGLTVLSDFFEFSESQFYGLLIAFCIIIGSYGIYRLAGILEKDDERSALMIMLFIPFYFLNLWSVERIVHIWIWFTYAIFPLFMSFGLTFFRSRRDMITYSLLLGFFGFIPHSFIYLAFFHVLGAAKHYIDGKRRDLLVFLILPVAAFILLNMPAILIGIMTKTVYPIEVTHGDLYMLSRNGDLINALAFSNNWWPQVAMEDIVDNLLFRMSSISIFAVALLSFAKTRKHPPLMALSFAAIVILLILVQGTNVSAISFFVDKISDAGLEQMFALFREWARLSILIPLLLMITLLLAKRYDYLVAAIIIINLAVSPSWIYLNENFNAVHTPQQYLDLKEKITGNYKTIAVGPENIERIYGIPRSSWDTSKTHQNLLGIGEGYDNWELGERIQGKDLPKNLLDVLNIKYIIFKTDFFGGSGWAMDYSYLGCEDVGNLSLCINPIKERPFRTYRDLVYYDDLDSITYPDLKGIAPSKENDSSYIMNRLEEGKKSIFAYEAEDIGGDNMSDQRSSGNAIARIGNISKEIMTNGGYHRFMVRANGSLTITLSNYSFPIDSDVMQIHEYDVELAKGKAILTATGNGSLDSFYLVEGGLIEPPGPVSFERNDVNDWTVHTNATSPFFLSFAETFDENFEARIYSDGKLVSVQKPFRIFGYINGFRIDGGDTIRIIHYPQEIFDTGLIVSWITALVLLAAWVRK